MRHASTQTEPFDANLQTFKSTKDDGTQTKSYGCRSLGVQVKPCLRDRAITANLKPKSRTLRIQTELGMSTTMVDNLI